MLIFEQGAKIKVSKIQEWQERIFSDSMSELNILIIYSFIHLQISDVMNRFDIQCKLSNFAPRWKSLTPTHLATD